MTEAIIAALYLAAVGVLMTGVVFLKYCQYRAFFRSAYDDRYIPLKRKEQSQ